MTDVDHNAAPPGMRVLRQKHLRQSLAVPVCRRDGTPGDWRSINVSEGGCFVAGGPFLKPGEQLEVTLTLGVNEISARARVAWINAEGAQSNRLPSGMGLQFVELDETVRSALRYHLDRLQNQTLAEFPELTGEALDTLPAGAMIGQFRVLQLLGSGGMGAVYLCQDDQQGRCVAVKTLHPELAHDPTIVRRFFDEARAVNLINHENIVAITDFCSDGARNFFVMELLDGQTLTQAQRDGVLPLGRAVAILRQLARALAAAHDRGITHRDLKPDNVFLVTRDEQRDFVKLLDFGIAKLAASNVGMTKTATGLLLGTPGYIAPEQILGHKADYRADIYAFGAVAYQLISGNKPFVADSWPELLMKHAAAAAPRPRAEHTALPETLVAMVMACLEKTPEARPQDMHAIGRQLDAIAADIHADRPAPPLRERRSLVVATALVAVALTGTALTLLTKSLRAPRPAVTAPASIPEPPATRTAADPQAALKLDMVQQYLKAGDYPQALRLCEALLQVAPKPGLVYRAMTYAYAGLGQKDQACQALRAYQRLTPGATDAKKLEAGLGGCH